ncbi:hypothetical protein ACIBI9_19390 [Nonomuraea sp. NPDC050451]|uniref:hypothetical protein n=1 Tax=Nonomuraea sp. NPDC050451 TaxID=3364364 RepID=UPI0037A659C2
MFVVIVRLQVRPDRLETFLDGIRANARAAPHYAAWRQVAEACVIEHRNTFCHPVSLQGQAT